MTTRRRPYAILQKKVLPVPAPPLYPEPYRLNVMGYCGPIECPNCHCPVGTTTTVCPYCYSSLRTAPWKMSFSGKDSWCMVALIAVAFFGLAAVMISDRYFDTDLVGTIQTYLSKNP